MRFRRGNFFQDDHRHFIPNWTARCYEFITYPDRNPFDIPIAIEAVVPKLVLYGRGKLTKRRIYDRSRINIDGSHWFEEFIQMPMGNDPSKWGHVNGCVFTSYHPDEQKIDPCLHIAFLLYETPCNNTKCLAGHMNDNTGTVHTVAPQLEQWQLEAIEEEVGVHPSYRLGGPNDVDILSLLGFTVLDAPLRGSKVDLDNMYTSLDYLARTDVGCFAYKSQELIRLGYPIDLGLIHMMVKAHRLEEQVPSMLVAAG